MAYSFECDNETDKLLIFCYFAIFSALSLKIIWGALPLLLKTSISFHFNPLIPVPNAFITASFAANLVAN